MAFYLVYFFSAYMGGTACFDALKITGKVLGAVSKKPPEYLCVDDTKDNGAKTTTINQVILLFYKSNYR
jgi:hypothetical protein